MLVWFGLIFCPSLWALDVEVSKSGTVQTIQDTIDQIGEEGGTITIMDSEAYEETFVIGDELNRVGEPITITSPFSGDERPVITPTGTLGPFVEAHRSDRLAGTAVFTDGCTISNLIIESNPDAEGAGGDGSSAIFIMADNVVIDNVLIRPRAGTRGITKYPNTGIFFAQEGAGGVADIAGRMCNDCVVRNCEFIGVATDGETEPITESIGYLDDGENGQFATFLRTGHFTNDNSQMVEINVENSSF